MAAVRSMPMNSRSYASPEEVALAFAGLGDADFARLGRIARLRARGLPEVDWRDLLQEAAHRALEGDRRWPPEVPFIVFMAASIRSIASEAWRRRALTRPSERVGDEDADPLANLADDGADPERAAIARDLVQHLQALFADDPLARAVLEGLADGLSPTEIQTRGGLTSTEYESTRRRMRRAIARARLETPE